MHCRRYHRPLTRREMLSRCANGFGAVALTALTQDPASGAGDPRPPHHPAKANSVVVLVMAGGPSQVDTFDPKPRLDREHGQPMRAKVQPTQFNNNGTVLRSPWKFRRRGQSGLWVSDLLPHTAACADELAVVRSMVSNFS